MIGRTPSGVMLADVNEPNRLILDSASERQARSEAIDALPSPRRHAVDRSSQGWVRERPAISRPLRLQLLRGTWPTTVLALRAAPERAVKPVA